MAKPKKYLALLRGINVGGNRRLPMASLVEQLETLGATDVRTYIQSGNAAYLAGEDLAPALSERLREQLDLDVPVIGRTATQIRRARSSCPFETGEPELLHIGFLSARPTKKAIAAIDPDRSVPDAVKVIGQHLYLRCPEGLARTKYTSRYLDATLGVITTIRNWRTLEGLLELARA